MQKQNKNGFRFYSLKDQTPYSYVNFMNQVPQQPHFLNNSIEKPQQSEKKSQQVKKTKIIQKNKEKEKEDIKRYDRGGNCVASNTSKLFIKILNKRLSKFPIIENYLNFYDIYSQKENILLIPLCLYSFLKQYEQNSYHRFLSQNQVAQKKIFSQEKINTKTAYLDIINQLKQHIQCSLENSKAKYKDCPEIKKQFHLKNISIYNKISEIIKKVQQLANCFQYDKKNYNKPQEIKASQNDYQHQNLQENQMKPSKKSLLPHELNTDVKIQEEQLNYNQFNHKTVIPTSQDLSKSSIQKYNQLHCDLQTFQSPLQSLYERKQRQYQKAMDKVYSIIMNERPLRQLFQIYKLNIKEILIESVNYCYRRNINSRVKKNQKMIKQVYEKLQNAVIQKLNYRQLNRNSEISLRRWQFLISYLTLKIAGDKKEQIYDEFKQNIKRKTKYFNFIQQTSSQNQKQSFDKQYYSYSLRYLQACFEKQKNRKGQSQNKSKILQEFKEWLIGYNYHNELNKLILSNPKYPNQSMQNNLVYPHSIETPHLSQTHGVFFPTLQPYTLSFHHFTEVKKQQTAHDLQKKPLKDYIIQQMEQQALNLLIEKYQQLEKQNYQGVI